MAKTMKILGWVVTSVLALFIAGLAFIHFMPGYDFSLVRSGSMTPVIKTGDIIITGPVNAAGGDIKPGAVVMYLHDVEMITHRLLSIDGDALVTKGDALEDADPWPVVIADVKGVYLFKLPYLGYVMNFIRTKTGWFLAVIIPTAVIVGLLIKDILKEAFKDERKTAKNLGLSPVVQGKETHESAE